jgi:hypothetical protein
VVEVQGGEKIQNTTVSRNERRKVMKSLIVSIVVTGLALTASAQSILFPDWKSVKTTQCAKESDKGFRCVLGGATSLVKVAPVDTTKNFAFDYEEWHSACGFPGGKMQEQRYSNLSSSVLLLPLNAGGGITCREIFIRKCVVGTDPKPCSEAVSVDWTTYSGNR